MKKIFTQMFCFFKRKDYQPNQTDIPVFDEAEETTFYETPQTTVAVPVSQKTTGLSVVGELKNVKAEIATFEKAIRELSERQVL